MLRHLVEDKNWKDKVWKIRIGKGPEHCVVSLVAGYAEYGDRLGEGQSGSPYLIYMS